MSPTQSRRRVLIVPAPHVAARYGLAAVCLCGPHAKQVRDPAAGPGTTSLCSATIVIESRVKALTPWYPPRSSTNSRAVSGGSAPTVFVFPQSESFSDVKNAKNNYNHFRTN